MIEGQLDAQYNPINGSGVTTDQDINSPETRKALDVEMAYWLTDWLAKEQLADSKSGFSLIYEHDS